LARFNAIHIPKELAPSDFWERAIPEPNSGCLLWTGALTRGDRGYGVLKVGGRKGPVIRAHRLAWELERGPIPDGLLLCHRCDTPECINPAHLFLGTDADNHRDMDRKGRSRGGSSKGEAHPGAKLTDADVAMIRELNSAGMGPSSLARQFGISQATAWNIVNRNTWRHIPERAHA
jgi:hypothetical protein